MEGSASELKRRSRTDRFVDEVAERAERAGQEARSKRTEWKKPDPQVSKRFFGDWRLHLY